MSLIPAPARIDARRFLELLAVLILSVSGIGLLMLRLGIFDAAPAWIGSALCTFWYHRATKKWPVADGFAVPTWHLVLLILVALLFRLPPYAYVLGGQDQGIYMNAAMELTRTGGLLPMDTVLARIGDPAVLEKYRHANYVGDYLPGIYATHDGLRFQFYHLFPVWLALFGDGFGPQVAVYALTFFSLVSVLFFYRLAQLITGSAFAGLAAGLLLAVNPLHAFFSKFPVTEVPTLAFSLMSFSLLLVYWNEPRADGQRRFVALSVAAMACLFFTRISGFMYVPFVAAVSIVAMLFDADVRRRTSVVAWAACVFVAYAASIAYGLKWSSNYSNDIYRLTFGMLTGVNGKSLLVGLLCVGIGAWALILAASRYETTAAVCRAALLFSRRLLPYIGIAVVLAGAYRAYKLGYTDAYASDPWAGKRFGLSHQGSRSLMSTTLIASAIYLSPFILLAYFAAAFSARRSALLSSLLLFTTIFIVFVILLQGVVAYQPYYARYMVSEWVPYALLLVVCACCTDERSRGPLGAALLLGGLFCAGLSLAQLGKQEHAGVAESVERLASRFDRGDLILIDGRMKTPAAHELKTTLRFTRGLNVATVTREDLDDIYYLQGLAAPYDEVYLLSNDKPTSGFSEVDSVRFIEHAYRHAASPPLSLVLRNDGNIHVSKFNPAVFEPLNLRLVFGQGKNSDKMLVAGWSAPEPWGVWTMEKAARLDVDVSGLDLSHASSLSLTLSGRAFVTEKSPRQRIVLALDGKQVGVASVEYPQARVDLKIEVPTSSVGSAGRLLFELTLPDAVSPHALGYSADARTLAFGLERMTLQVNTVETSSPDK